jgi:large subunit ribosomal protein L15
MKGQKSRSGKGLRLGFEGGQLQLIKGLPMKRGFTNPFKTYYSLIKIDILDNFSAGDSVTPEVLHQRGYLRNLKQPIKIVGDGELSKPVTVAAHKFTRAARQKIEAAQGTVQEL